MKKLNQKGTTVVELLVSFTLLMILMIGMFNLILSLKEDASKSMFKENLTTFRNNLTVIIQQDIITEKLSSITPCSNDNLICYDLNFNETTKRLVIDKNSKVIRYAGLIHEVPNKEDLVLGNSTISLENDIFKINIPIKKNNSDETFDIKITAILNI